VKSITQRTADSSGSVDEMASHLSGRLDAFARVQSAVTRNPDRGIDLKGLIADELLAHAAHEGEQVRIKGPDIALRPKAAESISLALHELTTNAVKHGALTNAHGRININWKMNGDGSSMEFQWAETHPDGKIEKATRQGFGMELLTRILPYDLNAQTKVEFERQGLRFTMDLPLENVMQD
jgi:two-component sensor histidine kinase